MNVATHRRSGSHWPLVVCGLAVTVLGCNETEERLARLETQQQELKTVERERDDALRAKDDALRAREEVERRLADAESKAKEQAEALTGARRAEDAQRARADNLASERDAAVRAARSAPPAATRPAGNIFRDQMLRKMAAAVLAASGNGWTLAQFNDNRLGDSARQEWAVNVGSDRSQSYKIVGACDDDCGDLDFELFETDGRKVDDDRASDALPIVDIPAGHTGNHTLRVIMEACRVNPCSYGYAVFTR